MANAAYEKLDAPVDDEFSDEGSEHDSPAQARARTSEDVRRRDQETLTREEEAERLLGGGGEKRHGKSPSRREKRQKKRASKREKRRSKRGEESEVMYEMEEGGPRSSSAESSGHSSEVDTQRLGEMQARQKVWLQNSAVHIEY